jgi:hypothetical protein
MSQLTLSSQFNILNWYLLTNVCFTEVSFPLRGSFVGQTFVLAGSDSSKLGPTNPGLPITSNLISVSWWPVWREIKSPGPVCHLNNVQRLTGEALWLSAITSPIRWGEPYRNQFLLWHWAIRFIDRYLWSDAQHWLPNSYQCAWRLKLENLKQIFTENGATPEAMPLSQPDVTSRFYHFSTVNYSNCVTARHLNILFKSCLNLVQTMT